jgi:hypothetical protein
VAGVFISDQIMVGNGEDDPAEIEPLVQPLLRNEADYVHGSRFLAGGSSVWLTTRCPLAL